MATPKSRRIVGVSLKMYFDLAQTSAYISSCTALVSKLDPNLAVDIFLIPDFISLSSANATLSQSSASQRLLLGAQDCFWEDRGAFTGEVSPSVLKSVGCSLVELGHAERRRLFGETDEDVVKKARACQRNGMTPLVCIGEKSRGSVEDAVREVQGQVLPVLAATATQTSASSVDRQQGREGEVWFAYEPVWAIGQKEAASAAHVVGVTKEIRRLCGERRVRILYGGSAGPGTFEPMKEGVDGLFLGRFAHDLANLEQVIKEVAES